MRDPMSVLVRPVVSEKTYTLMDQGTYVFVVDSSATKIDVRNAVEQAFGVKVKNVNTSKLVTRSICSKVREIVPHGTSFP